jgi:CheY-like chemotaxis protein
VKRSRVLLIDDETMILNAYRRMLADCCEVVTASGGQEAIDLLRLDARFDVIICDLMMPHVDGLMVYDQLKQLAPELVPRTIFCSGGADVPRTGIFGTRIGVLLLEKPIDAHVLKAAIHDRGARDS